MDEIRDGITYNMQENDEKIKANTAFLERLKKSMPEFFGSNESEDSFNLQKFLNALKERNVDELKDGYQLDFIGKDYARRQASERPTTVIVPDVVQNSGEGKNSKNLFFTGDNLEVLRHLQASYTDKVDVIYIDPPYNTGSDDFTYPDRFEYSDDKIREIFGLDDNQVERLKSIQGKSSHSAWLAFMYPRLVLAKRLLKDSGVIFISIDDNEQANLLLLMNEIFGESGMAANIHCQMSTTQGMKVKAAREGNIVKNAEFILCYTKNGRKNIAINPLYDYRPDYDEHYSLYLQEDGSIENLNKVYDYRFPKDVNNKDKLSLREAFRISNDFRNFVRTNLVNIVCTDKVGDTMSYDAVEQGKWREIHNGERSYLLTRDSRGSIKQLLRLSDSWGIADDFKGNEGLRKIRGNWWDGFYIDMGNVSKEGGGIKFSNGKKPVRLIRQLLKMSTKPDAVILDFFAGSATTADAVMQLNAEDGGHRKFIMVQLHEKTYHTNKDGKEVPTDGGKTAYAAGFKSIDEISRERIRRSAAKIREDNGLLPEYFDGSFKHYRVVEPTKQALDRIEEFNSDNVNLFNDMVSSFSSDALNVAGNATGAQTILTTWLVRDGYSLDADVREISIGGYKAYLVEASRLYLIDDGWTKECTRELLNRLGEHELSVQSIVLWGYSFNIAELRELEIGIGQLNNSVNLLKRY